MFMKRVTINADDFGLNKSCTDAICEAFEKNLITDTTLVANGDAFEYALEKIKLYSLENKIGIHVNLNDGTPLTDEMKKCAAFVRNGEFHGKINRFMPLNSKTRKIVYNEIVAQVEKIQRAGLMITHADSHHHIHTIIFIAPIFVRVCKEKGISKIRIHRNIGHIKFYKRMGKFLYNQWLRLMKIKTVHYFGMMSDVEKVGIYDDLEIMVHPEYDTNHKLIDKIDEKNGCPVGKLLQLPEKNVLMRGYKDI